MCDKWDKWDEQDGERIVNFELGTNCKLPPAGEILSIRDKLTKEFNIDKYNPKNKKNCTE